MRQLRICGHGVSKRVGAEQTRSATSNNTVCGADRMQALRGIIAVLHYVAQPMTDYKTKAGRAVL